VYFGHFQQRFDCVASELRQAYSMLIKQAAKTDLTEPPSYQNPERNPPG
jgi:hypothetical protein